MHGPLNISSVKVQMLCTFQSLNSGILYEQVLQEIDHVPRVINISTTVVIIGVHGRLLHHVRQCAIYAFPLTTVIDVCCRVCADNEYTHKWHGPRTFRICVHSI